MVELTTRTSSKSVFMNETLKVGQLPEVNEFLSKDNLISNLDDHKIDNRRRIGVRRKVNLLGKFYE